MCFVENLAFAGLKARNFKARAEGPGKFAENCEPCKGDTKSSELSNDETSRLPQSTFDVGCSPLP
jgi:hypothetical protein